MLTAYVTDPEGTESSAIYCVLDGVIVGPAGELVLISTRDGIGSRATEFKIYAPGTWKEVSVEPNDD